MTQAPKQLITQAIEANSSKEVTFKRVPKDKLRESIKIIQKNHADTLKQLETR